MSWHDLTWKCHVCGEERPDRFISVMSRQYPIAGTTMTTNVRYCNDRAACAAGARENDPFAPKDKS